MNQLTKKSNLSPASFESPNAKLTKEQGFLLDLIKERIDSKQPITREDILDLYLSKVKKTDGYDSWVKRYNFDLGKWEYTGEVKRKYFKEQYNIKTLSIQWFKNNLGAVIIKGKIMIIPIIEA